MSKSIVEGSTDKALPLPSKYGRMCGHASKHELHLVTFAAIDRVGVTRKSNSSLPSRFFSKRFGRSLVTPA
jgi:hypothetical protein